MNLALRPTNPDKSADRQAAEQDVFMREVDDALRQDQMFGFFRSYGMLVAGLVVAGLVAFAGYLWWDHSKTKAADEHSEQYVIALDQLDGRNLKGADDKLKLIAADSGTASAVSAKLLRAGIALEQKRTQEALTLYAEVAADQGAPKPYRDLATVRQVAVQFDTMKPQDVVDKLKPLAVPGNAWFGVAGELVGIAYLKMNQPDLAGPLFADIARDEKAPESLRGRARQLAGLLGVDAIDDEEKPAKSGEKAGPADEAPREIG
ncbi:MAG TPA: tetratricopeptide repeat protein [Novosphingobium sp.]|nr:tetratricopeptide repeat protein [Novosphingobium sp.]